MTGGRGLWRALSTFTGHLALPSSKLGSLPAQENCGRQTIATDLGVVALSPQSSTDSDDQETLLMLLSSAEHWTFGYRRGFRANQIPVVCLFNSQGLTGFQA